MGIRSSRCGRAFCLTLVTAGLSFASVSARELNTGIWKVMREAGAGTFDDEEDHAWPVGDIHVGGRQYRIVHFEYLQSKRHMVPGGVQHGATRLLVFEVLKERLVYLGGYTYFAGDFSPNDDRPHIEGDAVVFPYKENEIMGVKINKRIVFGKNGPPAQVVLGGEICTLFK